MSDEEYKERDYFRGHYTYKGWVKHPDDPILCKECTMKRQRDRIMTDTFGDPTGAGYDTGGGLGYGRSYDTTRGKAR